MLKRCPECSTKRKCRGALLRGLRPLFDAPQAPSDLKVFMGALAMFAIVIVAVAFLRSFVG